MVCIERAGEGEGMERWEHISHKRYINTSWRSVSSTEGSWRVREWRELE